MLKMALNHVFFNYQKIWIKYIVVWGTGTTFMFSNLLGFLKDPGRINLSTKITTTCSGALT